MPSPLPILFATVATTALWLSAAGLALADQSATGSLVRRPAIVSGADVLANQQGKVRQRADDASIGQQRRPVDSPPLKFKAGGSSPAGPVRFDPAVEPASLQRASPSADSSPQASEGDRLASPKKGKPLAISPSNSDGSSGARPTKSHSLPLVTVAASLAVVLGLFFLVAWLMRRGLPKGGQLLPTEALEVLGRTPLPGKQQLQLLRFGNKLLLVSMAPGVAETLAEISDPTEVDRLVGLCQQNRSGSATAVFRNILQQISTNRKPTVKAADGPVGASQEASSGARTVRDMLEEHDD